MKNIYLSLLTFFFVGCSLNNTPTATCSDMIPAGVETVVAKTNPDATGYQFDVAFRVLDGCGNFGSFQQTIEGNVTTIQVIAQYEGCNCPQNAPLRQTVYTFNQTVPGTYILKFKMSENNYITKTVLIE